MKHQAWEGELLIPPRTEGESSPGIRSLDSFLLYDGECVYCRTFARKSRIRTPAGKRLRFIDGREAPGLVKEFRQNACDLEDGMILVLEGRRYQGAEAMAVLGSMATEPGWVLVPGGRVSFIRGFAAYVTWVCGSPANPVSGTDGRRHIGIVRFRFPVIIAIKM